MTRRGRASTENVEQMKADLVAKYAAMGPADIIQELLSHEGAEGFSYGLADRAAQIAFELRAREPRPQAFSGLCGEIDMQGKPVPPLDLRPANCRNRLQAEGKPYPKSGCDVCGSIVGSNWSCRYV